MTPLRLRQDFSAWRTPKKYEPCCSTTGAFWICAIWPDTPGSSQKTVNVGGFGSAKGPAEILAFMQKNLGTGPNRNNSFHILSNFEIEVKGDSATAWSRWTFITPGPDGKPVISQAGRYDDILVREDGHWKFKRRSASNDIPVMP